MPAIDAVDGSSNGIENCHIAPLALVRLMAAYGT